MKQLSFRPALAIRVLSLGVTLAACTGLLSCATAPETPPGDLAFHFTVMLYKEPVEVTAWRTDPAQSANPEGAALNIITAMQRGDVEQWQGDWDESERPKITKEYREALLKKWTSLKDGRVMIVGRVVADADIVIELSVRSPQLTQEKVQIPLKRAESQWWLTAMDSKSGFLNWESSNNKIMAHHDTYALRAYLNGLKNGASKLRAQQEGQPHP